MLRGACSRLLAGDHDLSPLTAERVGATVVQTAQVNVSLCKQANFEGSGHMLKS